MTTPVASVNGVMQALGGPDEVRGGALIRTLLANDFGDQALLTVCPVIVSQGTRWCPQGITVRERPARLHHQYAN